MKEKKFCKFCGEEINKSSIVCPKCGRQLETVKITSNENSYNNKIYEQQWFMWLVLVFFAPIGILLMWKFNKNIKKSGKIALSIIFGIIFLSVAFGRSQNNEKENIDKTFNLNKNVSINVIDFSTMAKTDINSWCNENKVDCNITDDYSNTIEKGNFISQSIEYSKIIHEGDSIKIVYSLGKKPSTEYTNALKKAESYSKIMHMSKRSIYDQLVSEYGEKFPADAAQYAIDNIAVDWNVNALSKAKSYQQTMNMSKSAIYEQLISEYGEKFTNEEAQYAIDHLDN